MRRSSGGVAGREPGEGCGEGDDGGVVGRAETLLLGRKTYGSFAETCPPGVLNLFCAPAAAPAAAGYEEARTHLSQED